MLALLIVCCACYEIDQEKSDKEHSVVRLWSREIIADATRGLIGPTINARNMFLASVSCEKAFIDSLAGNVGFLGCLPTRSCRISV